MLNRKAFWYAVGVIALLGLVAGYNYRQKCLEAWKRELLVLRSQIQLGDPQDQTERLLEKSWPAEYLNAGIVRTPLQWGAHNWNLCLEFDKDGVAAIAVRTDDSYRHPPLGAPPDLVKPGFRPFWSPE